MNWLSMSLLTIREANSNSKISSQMLKFYFLFLPASVPKIFEITWTQRDHREEIFPRVLISYKEEDSSGIQ